MTKQTIDFSDFEIAPDIPKVFDRGARRFAFDELPTISKRFFTHGTSSGTSDLGSVTPGGPNEKLRVTRIHFQHVKSGTLILADKNGTVDMWQGTIGEIDLSSGPRKPLYVTTGYTRLRSIGSLDRYNATLEGFGPNADVLKPYRDGS